MNLVRRHARDELARREHTLDWVVWTHILWVLHQVGGNRSRAARILGIERTSLVRKLKKRPPWADEARYSVNTRPAASEK